MDQRAPEQPLQCSLKYSTPKCEKEPVLSSHQGAAKKDAASIRPRSYSRVQLAVYMAIEEMRLPLMLILNTSSPAWLTPAACAGCCPGTRSDTHISGHRKKNRVQRPDAAYPASAPLQRLHPWGQLLSCVHFNDRFVLRRQLRHSLLPMHFQRLPIAG